MHGTSEPELFVITRRGSDIFSNRAGKTVEIRRSEAAGDRGKASSQPDLERLFLTAVQDRHRPRINLAPLPAPVPPPKPPTPCVFSPSTALY